MEDTRKIKEIYDCVAIVSDEEFAEISLEAAE